MLRLRVACSITCVGDNTKRSAKLFNAINAFVRLRCANRTYEAVLIWYPNWVKTDLGKYNVPPPAELNESFNLENSGSFRDFKGQQLPW
jgi:hypothetical protein